MLVVAATAPHTGGALPAAQTGAISGVVIDGSTGRPLHGAAVALRGTGVKVSAGSLTDSKGRFVFTDLPAFDGYSLSASKAGYVSGALMLRSLFSTGARLSLAEGEWRSNLTIDMWPLGSITGMVVDERGEPVVDVPVRVLMRILLGGSAHWAGGPVTRTDDRGFYRIAGLGRGSYVVNVPSVQSVVPSSVPLSNLSGLSGDDLEARRMAAPRIPSLDLEGLRLLRGSYATPPHVDGPPQVYPQVFYPTARSLLEATPIDLADGERRHGVDLQLPLVSTSRVAGQIIGPPEVIAGLTLRLLPAGSESLGPGAEQATTMVGGGGAFTFGAVPAGAYTLQATTSASRLAAAGLGSTSVLPGTPGRRAGRLSLVTLGESAMVTSAETPDDVYSAEQAVLVESRDIEDLRLVLERGATISGRVELDGGKPVPSRVRVWIEPASGDPALGRFETETDPAKGSAGAFSIQGLRRGEYVVRATAGTLLIKSIAAGRDLTGRPFDVAAGADITGVVVTLTEDAATLSGAIRHADGSVARDAAVILFPVERAQWTGYGLSPLRIRSRVSFGPDGYRLTNLPGGDYYVVAVESRMQEAWRDPRFLEAAALVADRLSLGWGAAATHNVTLRHVLVR